jgi:hypothetical protein
MFLVYELARDIAIAKQQVIVDISQKNVSFDSTSLVSMVPSRNKVSPSSRGFSTAKVKVPAGKIPVFFREQLVSAQKEELAPLPCFTSFSVEEAANDNACYFMKD